MAAQIQLRRDTASNWTSANPTLAQGELGYETDTGKIKIGDGSTAWTSLDYYYNAAGLNDISDVTITSAADGDFLRWNGSAWINDAVNLGTDSVGDYVESLVAGTGVSLTNNTGEGATPTVAIGQAVGTTDNVTFNTLTTDAGITVGGHIVPDTDVTYDLGSTDNRFRDLYLSGTTIDLGGVEITSDGSTVSIPSLSTTSGLTGDLTGNADTASALETARTIQISGDASGSASFDGSGDINIAVTIQPDSVALGTDTTGNYTESVTGGTGVTVTGGTGEGNTPTVAIGQAVSTTDNVTFNTVTADLTGDVTGNVTGNVTGDLTGDVTGNVTGDVTGNADTATTLATARTISLSGDVAGSVSFDGSANVDIAATIQANSIALGTDTTGDYVANLVNGTGITLANNSGESAQPTISIGQDVATSANVAFNTVTLGAAPTQATHAATKSYVDNLAAGIDWHEAARLATAAALPDTPTYSNGTSGDGATLTAGSQARLLIDGANANTGDRVLVKNQSNGYENGIYDVTNQGAAGSAAWVLTRAEDFDGTQPGGVQPGEAVFVLAGSTNSNQGFVVTSTNDPHTIGTDSITFTQFTGTQAFSAGGGLTKTGNTIDIVTADSGRIVVNADNIDLGTVTVGSTTGSDTSDFVSAVTTDAYGRVTSIETSNAGQNLLTTSDVTFNSVTASLTGNASTATALATSRTIELTGDVTGSASFDGTANASLAVTIAANSVALGTDTTGNFMTDVSGGTGVTVTHTPGEGSTATIAIGQDVASGANVTFGTVTANLTGNVTGDLTGDVTGTVSGISNHSIGGLSDVDMTTVAPSQGDIAYFDGTNWVAEPWTIQGASGVSTSAESSGDILLYNGTNYVNTAHTLENVTNVTITSVSDGQFLKWDNGTSNWVNASIPTINSVADIGDVSISGSPSGGQVLRWSVSDSAWVNTDILVDTPLTGTPTAPTATAGTNTTQIATTEFVSTAVANLVDSAPGTLDTLNELAAALGDDANFSTTVTNSLALKAPLASPTFTGTVTLPTGTVVRQNWYHQNITTTVTGTYAGQMMYNDSTNAVTFTIAPQSSGSWSDGDWFEVTQVDTGQVTVAGGSGVTINGANGFKCRERYSVIICKRRSSDSWLVYGDTKT